MSATYKIWKNVYDDGIVLFAGRYIPPTSSFATEKPSLEELAVEFSSRGYVPNLFKGDSITTIPAIVRAGFSESQRKFTQFPVKLEDIFFFEKQFEEKPEK